MAALPYIQLYIAEYLADTAHLTTLQHGAYLLLIFNYWQRGKPLSNSSERLASVARMSNEEWKNIEPVLAEFFEVTESEWVHHRIESDLVDVLSKSTKASAAGKASAKKRYGKPPLNECSTNDELLRSDIDKEEEQNNTKNQASKEYSEVLRVYEAYPHKVGKGAAIKAIEKSFALLRKRNEPDPEKFLLEHIQGWIDKRERDRAAGNFVPEYPNPSTWFNQERFDDEDNLPKPKKEWHVLTDEEAEASWEEHFAIMGMGQPHA
jgi:uncharacterized protein YdaU (DUF1376 family)